MAEVQLQEIFRLSVDERIRLVEAIWDSIAESPESLPVTPAQRAELDRRLAEHRANPQSARPWEEVLASLDEDG